MDRQAVILLKVLNYHIYILKCYVNNITCVVGFV